MTEDTLTDNFKKIRAKNNLSPRLLQTLPPKLELNITESRILKSGRHIELSSSIYGFQLIKQPVRSMILFESICCLKEDFGLIEKLISLASKAKVGALLLRNLNPLVNKVNFSESLGEIEAMVWPLK